MSPNLAEKICLVTGASRGIGRGIALQLAQAGATVYITGRNIENLQKCADEMKEKGAKAVIPVKVDHSNDNEVKGLFDQIKSERNGKLDVLVNNAYSAVNMIFDNANKPFWEDDPATSWDMCNNVGLRNHFICTSYAARIMSEHKSGVIVNISSAGGLKYLFNVPYGVGKAAVDRMTQDTAFELRKSNVAVVGLWPGPVKTEIIKDRVLDNEEAPSKSREMFAIGETVEFTGKCVANLAADSDIMKKTGRILFSVDVANEYKFTEDDGTMPFDTMSLKAVLRQMKYHTLSSYTPQFLKIPKTLIYLAGYKF